MRTDSIQPITLKWVSDKLAFGLKKTSTNNRVRRVFTLQWGLNRRAGYWDQLVLAFIKNIKHYF